MIKDCAFTTNTSCFLRSGWQSILFSVKKCALEFKVLATPLFMPPLFGSHHELITTPYVNLNLSTLGIDPLWLQPFSILSRVSDLHHNWSFLVLITHLWR